MSFVAQDHSHLAGAQDRGLQLERLVGNYEDGIGRAAAESVHESTQVFIDFLLGPPVHGERVWKPFVVIVVPVVPVSLYQFLTRLLGHTTLKGCSRSSPFKRSGSIQIKVRR